MGRIGRRALGFARLSRWAPCALLFACAHSPQNWTCGTPGETGEPPALPRALDVTPRVTRLDPALPPGRAEAYFTADTGMDQMGGPRMEAGLVLVVRFGDQELRRTFASCADLGLGSALGGSTDTVLEVAACGQEYWLMPERGSVVVRRVRAGAPEEPPVVRIDLPSRDMIAVSRTPPTGGTVAREAPATDASKLVDPARAARVAVVLRVTRLAPGTGDKYAWAPVRVLAVIKNSSGQALGSELQVAYYSFKSGVPEGDSTVYLEPYNDTPNHPWKLLGGSAEQGVSHVSGGNHE